MRRSLLALNAGLRLAYGAGTLASPAAMERLGMAPAAGDRPPERLFVRAFGGHMIGVAALGLLALRREGLVRPAASAAVAIDLADVVSALVEAAARRRLDRDLAGGLAFSSLGAISAAAVLRRGRQAPLS